MNEWPENIVRLSDIRARKLNALSPYGPVRAGLITSQTIQSRQLSELLNDLERKVKTLQSRSSTVLDTCTIALMRARVALLASTTETDGTDV